MNSKKIFFSYSRTDASDFALKLAVDLKKEGFNVWIDQQDIPAGSEWDLEIEKALETCDLLLFIESENSVVSNNVLDEVYYALGQNKTVIPVIMHDSKTPFRIQRLQHVDFTRDYEKGLAHLINELKRDVVTQFSQPGTAVLTRPGKPFFQKSAILILIAAILVIIAVSAVIYSTNAGKEPVKSAEKTVSLIDSVRRDSNLIEAEQELLPKKAEKLTEEKNEKKVQPRITDKKEVNKVIEKTLNLNESFAGSWNLVDVEPKVASMRGWLKIEETTEKKLKIESSFQFYYFKTNDTAFFVVFNGFASCPGCIVQDEIKLINRDIAIGTQRYIILKESQPGTGMAGDTVSSAGSNTSIRATVSLQMINSNTLLIKVRQPVVIPISDGFVVKPFVYSFRFIKND